MPTTNHDFNQWQRPDSTIHEVFRSVVKRSPYKKALVDTDISFTYSELDDLSEGLAGFLQSKGINANHVIGLYLEHSYEYIVLCLAILKAGCSYLDLNLAYSQDVIAHILLQASPIAVVSKTKYLNRIPPCNALNITIDNGIRSYLNRLDRNKALPNDCNSIAFIGYSSGTTGKPKGVRVSHRAALYAYSKFWQEICHIPEATQFGYSTYLPWDAMSPILFNATGYIVPDTTINNPLALVSFFDRHTINHTFLTPSLLRRIIQNVPEQVLKQALAGLRVIWLGGEPVSQELVNHSYRLMPKVCLINNYGPSECFVVAQGILTRNETNASKYCPVGKVLPEMEILILRDESEESHMMGIGELYATGPCLADSYINNPKLTAEKFIRFGDTMYFRTGDLASQLPNGSLVIHGRAEFAGGVVTDTVCLPDIEVIIRQSLVFRDCVVASFELGYANREWICYFVRSSETPSDVNHATVLNALETKLPNDMIPNRFIELTELPVNSISRKIDFQRLRQLAY